MPRTRAPGTSIVWRFAVVTLVVFVAIGVVISTFRTQEVREREEADAADVAEIITGTMVRPLLRPSDLDGPITGERYEEIREHVETFLVHRSNVLRIKIWNTSGVIVFSNDRDQIGLRPEIEHDLEEALQGERASEISDLSEPENWSERRLAPQLFETYVPLRFAEGGPVAGVVEVYQDYSPIQAEITALTRTLTLTLGIGLLLLYAVLLPVMIGATRILRRQNDQLTELLDREHATVEELRELDRMKSDFVAAASHELRSPLTTIRGWTRTLLDSPAAGEPATREALDAIERQSGRVYRLVQNLLREAQLEDPDPPQRSEGVRVGDLLRHLPDDFPEARGRLDLLMDEALPVLTLDRQLLEEIVVNLVDNALKYSPAERSVEVGARLENEQLVVWVRDHGPGIPEGDLPRIFDRFHQLDGSMTRSQSGVGLGLHLVKAWLDRIGGRIDVRSRLGEGSTFSVRIPVRITSDEVVVAGSS